MEALHLRVAEYREELNASRHEARRLKKAVKAAEVQHHRELQHVIDDLLAPCSVT